MNKENTCKEMPYRLGNILTNTGDTIHVRHLQYNPCSHDSQEGETVYVLDPSCLLFLLVILPKLPVPST